MLQTFCRHLHCQQNKIYNPYFNIIMKKVLILSSSPRRGGNSDTLCDAFMEGAIANGNEVEKIFLRDKTIHPCLGCSTCSLHKKPCPQKDDAAEIINKMLQADVIVMGTPVYFYSMSTAAEDGGKIMDRIVTSCSGFLDWLENPAVKGTVFCGGVWHVGEIKGKPAIQEAYQMGMKV